jgi:glycosidase
VIEKRLQDLDFDALTDREFYPSPAAWEDEVLYFLMLDRFSDGNEKDYIDNDGNRVTTGTTPLFRYEDGGSATSTEADRRQWIEAGTKFVGGTLKGLTGKIGYLQRLGITAIWVSPIFKQVAAQETYHGYGIQNFIDVDPRFGTREDLRDMVRTAHQHGIRVVMDIILNHSGDVFAYDRAGLRCDVYDGAGELIGREACWQADGTVYGVEGYRDPAGGPTIPFGPVDLQSWPEAFPDGAIWPAEFQTPVTFTRKGKIKNWEFDPEFREGDFETLKDISLGYGPIDEFRPSAPLMDLCQVYKFWIAYADIDGFRVDTVKHMEDGATRLFTSAIHEFAETIGKENFYLIGEITGGRGNAVATMEGTGLNAALGINDIPDKIEYLVKGYRDPRDYFDLFRNSILVRKESHVWFRDHVVTTFDDHDQVRKGTHKARFCHDELPGQQNWRALLNVLALNVTTMGIPCIYYGSEQFFNGHGDDDRYLREAMFGGEFGAFESKGRHFFNEDGPVYKALARVLAIRKEKIVLRRGRQYLRPISGDGLNFGLPQTFDGQIRSVVPWSRIFNNREILVALNTDYFRPKTAWVTIDNGLHAAGDKMTCLYSTDEAQIGAQVTVEARNGKALLLTVPPGGLIILE